MKPRWVAHGERDQGRKTVGCEPWLWMLLRSTMPSGTAFVGGTLIDGTGAAPLRDAGVTVDEIGTVEAGKRPDVLVLDANPLDGPESDGRMAHVVKDGEIVERDRLPGHPVLMSDV